MAKLRRMDDKEFEDTLKGYFQLGVYNSSTKINYTENDKNKIETQMFVAQAYRKLKQEMKKKDVSKLTFSQNLYDLRTNNRLSLADMEKILGLGKIMLDNLEKGNKRINALSEVTIAVLLSKLNINITKYTQMIKNELTISTTKTSSVQTFARSKSTLSSDDRTKKMQHGIDAVMLQISKMNKQNIAIEEKHVLKIKKKLVEMGEIQLLE